MIRRAKNFIDFKAGIAAFSFLFCSCAFANDVNKNIYDSYLNAGDGEKLEIVGNVAKMGDAGLPHLKKILRTSLGKSYKEYEDVLNAIARVGTEKAAMLLKNEVLRAKRIDSRVPMKYLAKMGKKGLKHLIDISGRKELAFSKALMPFISPTSESVKAREAIVLIHDPAAVEDLGTLINNTWLRIPALKALSNLKASGYETQALKIWENRLNRTNERGYALGYLFAVDRDRYLPLLQKELSSFDAEAARLMRDNKDLRAKNARASLCCDQEDLLRIIFYMGGDPMTATSLAVFAESGLWDRRYERAIDDDQIFLSILGLGLSRSLNAKSTLLHFLQEDLLIKPHIADLAEIFSYEHPRWPWFYKYERGVNKNDGFPICAVAAIALGELGDPTVIPAIEVAARNNPDLKDVFDTAINMLRKNEASGQKQILSRRCAGENEMCGSIAGLLCCPGFACKFDGSYPDAGGKCVGE
ncbi:MAG: hypothetical protein A2X56_15140 [Nitrospirae bacterium GWC2_57_13]|jgi:hypothetical protein|nr:MAG: hypothetical protein A2X56_15140 [Nitrospirae bacterium GWC2_57_13]HAR44281.1 hypothetical protein [Bdellovibrionales bacterium]